MKCMELLSVIQICLWLNFWQPEHPGVRNGHRMIFHEGIGKVFLFGGANEREVLGDLWTLGHDRWEKLTSNGPSPRTFPSMSYDPDQNRIIIFGGNKVLFGASKDSSTFLNDTWEWKDSKWNRIQVNEQPSPRAEASIIYDKGRKRFVLYGGYRFDKHQQTVRLCDTWVFENNKWRKLTEKGTLSSNGTTMVYHERDKVIYMYGGNIPRDLDQKQVFSTWKFENDEWKAIDGHTPYFFNSIMSYDNHLELIVRFGGWNGKERNNQTWVFDKTWVQLEIVGPPTARNHHAMVYDKKNRHHVLFGGHNGDHVFGDTWIFRNNHWSCIIPYQETPRVENNH